MKWYFLLFPILCIGAFLSTDVYAVDPYVLTVAPSTTDIAVDPGGRATTRITAANQGSKSFALRVSPASYAVADGSYDATYTPLPGRMPVVDWLKITNKIPSSLGAGNYYDVELAIDVPANTPPGGYSASVLVETSASEAQSGVTATQRIAHIVYITVNGDIAHDGDVKLTAMPWIFMNTNEQAVAFSARNTGGANELASTRAVVTDVFGRTLLDESRERYVLPGTQRNITYAWQPQGIFGLYRIERMCDIAEFSCRPSVAWQLHMSPLFVAILLIVAGLYTMFMTQRRMRKRKQL